MFTKISIGDLEAPELPVREPGPVSDSLALTGVDAAGTV